MYYFTRTLLLLAVLAPSDGFSPSWRSLTSHRHTRLYSRRPPQNDYYNIPNEDGEDRWGIPKDQQPVGNQGLGVPPSNLPPRENYNMGMSRVPPNNYGGQPPNNMPQNYNQNYNPNINPMTTSPGAYNPNYSGGGMQPNNNMGGQLPNSMMGQPNAYYNPNYSGGAVPPPNSMGGQPPNAAYNPNSYYGGQPNNMNPQSSYPAYNQQNPAYGGQAPPNPNSMGSSPQSPTGYNPQQNPNYGTPNFSQQPQGSQSPSMYTQNQNYYGNNNIDSTTRPNPHHVTSGPSFNPITPDNTPNIYPAAPKQSSTSEPQDYTGRDKWGLPKVDPNSKTPSNNPNYTGSMPNMSVGRARSSPQQQLGPNRSKVPVSDNPSHNTPDLKERPGPPSDELRDYSGTDKWGLPKVDPLARQPSNNPNQNRPNVKASPDYKYAFDEDLRKNYVPAPSSDDDEDDDKDGPANVGGGDNPSHNAPDLRERPSPVDELRDYSGTDKWGLPKVDPLSREPSDNPNHVRMDLNLRAGPDYKYAHDEDVQKNFHPDDDDEYVVGGEDDDGVDDPYAQDDSGDFDEPQEDETSGGVDMNDKSIFDPLAPPSNNPNYNRAQVVPGQTYKGSSEAKHRPSYISKEAQTRPSQVSDPAVFVRNLNDVGGIHRDRQTRPSQVPSNVGGSQGGSSRKGPANSRPRPSQVADPADFVRSERVRNLRDTAKSRARPSQVADPADFVRGPRKDVDDVEQDGPLGDDDDESLADDVTAKEVDTDDSLGVETKDDPKSPSDRPTGIWGKTSNNPNYMSDKIRPGTTYDDTSAKNQPSYVSSNRKTRPSQISDPAEFVRGPRKDDVGKDDSLKKEKQLEEVKAQDTDKDVSSKKKDESKDDPKAQSDQPVWGKTSNNPNYISDKIRPGTTYDDTSAKNQPSYVSSNRKTRPSQIADPAEFVRNAPSEYSIDDENDADASPDEEKDSKSSVDSVYGGPSDNPNYNGARIRPGSTYGVTTDRKPVSPQRRPRPSQAAGNPDYYRTGPSFRRDFSSDNPSYKPTEVPSRRGTSTGATRDSGKRSDARGIIQPDGMRGVSGRRSPADSIQSQPLRPYTGRSHGSDDLSQKDHNQRDVRSRPGPARRNPSPDSQKGHNARDVRNRPGPSHRSSSDESQKGHNARDVR